MSKTPFTEDEQEIMNLLVKAHELFLDINENKGDGDWLAGIHKCQDVLIRRVVTRDYPNYFN